MSGVRSDTSIFTPAPRRRRFVRPLVWIAAVVALIVAVSVLSEWFRVYFPRPRLRSIAISFLGAAEICYRVLVIAVPVLVAVSAVILIRARRRSERPRWAARILALSVGLFVGSLLVEMRAAAWLRATRVRIPWLPTRFPDSPGDRHIDLLVIGESSAEGVPYSRWLSVGHIVGWKLGDAVPDRPVRLDIQAAPGHTLGNMQDVLAKTARRPELAIIYAGHNEFQTIYNWSHGAYHYLDATPPSRVTLALLARRFSPLCRTIGVIQDRLSLSVPPPRVITRELVDVPVYTPSEYRERLHDFRTRLEVTVSYLERLGALTVLIIPPSNDATFEPNRSVLRPEARKPDREAFARAFQAARAAEGVNTDDAIASFHALVEREPGFAESHFRLARLLERRGDSESAHEHYLKARDLDGFPMRCPSDFQDIYRDVAARHPKVILIDGPAELRRRSREHLLNEFFFNDGFHPSLNGHSALAEAVLLKLHERRAFGWPAGAGPPLVNPSECAEHFGMDATKWAGVCGYAARFYSQTAHIRYDPTERAAWAYRYREAARRIEAGESLSAIGLSGIGTEQSVSGDAAPRPVASPPRAAGS